MQFVAYCSIVLMIFWRSVMQNVRLSSRRRLVSASLLWWEPEINAGWLKPDKIELTQTYIAKLSTHKVRIVFITFLTAFSSFAYKCQCSVCIEKQSIRSSIVFGSDRSTNQNESEITKWKPVIIQNNNWIVSSFLRKVLSNRKVLVLICRLVVWTSKLQKQNSKFQNSKIPKYLIHEIKF